ncbi:MAG: 4-hydroxy-2-oxovalerate aldolase [Candidatus Falkowbacteria bacterium]|nr:4-hydroxy-2-oxovalerate aldolase [Candidatus Falkowbacteria bacterium]
MNDIKFFDSTLRDGSHAVSHQITADQIKEYCENIDQAGLYTIIIGHGNGLGASSHQIGFATVDDKSAITIARNALKKTRLGIFIIPGLATIENDLAPALKMGVDLVCVAAHCTEADVTQQYIRYLHDAQKEVYGVLMMYHMTTKERLVEEALKMQSYGAQGIIIMDSAGASTPTLVQETIGYLTKHLSIPVGFHAHNNFGIAVSNSLVALQNGATIIDGTVRGFGASAGNCQLEALVALLKKMNIETEADLYTLMDVSEKIVSRIMKRPQEIDTDSLMGGLTGVFSLYALPIKRAAEKYNVNIKDIYIELGKRNIVGGQEDMVIEVAKQLANKK